MLNENNKDKILQLQKAIDESSYIVFFGGAGVSTESGIPDFRSVDGLYNKKYDYPPETILSASFFKKNTEEFYKFYRDKMIGYEAKPNAAHIKLVELEKAGKLKAVITQNIDGLHQMAGSQIVYELHGSTLKNYCLNCGKHFNVDYIKNPNNPIPRCDSCGGIIKPDVVLYEEPLNNSTVNNAVNAILKSDCLIVAGTSLTVYPAASYIRYFQGKHFILINRDQTPADDIATLCIHDSVGEVLSKIRID